jgi:hypothetical protein
MVDVTCHLKRALNTVSEFQRHPLGFFYLRTEACTARSVRVHVWVQGEDQLPENAFHTHSYDIYSNVIIGGMSTGIYEFTPHGDGNTFEFQVDYTTGGSKLAPTGRRGSLDQICRFSSISGSSYRLSAGRIHRVTVFEKPCVTVLETVERDKKVFSYGEDLREPEFEREYIDERNIERIRRILLNEIDKTV